MNSASLFSEFEPTGYDSWTKQAEAELGAKFDTLKHWSLAPGVSVNAYATSEILNLEEAEQMRNCQKLVPGWLNLARLKLTTPAETNAGIRDALNHGANGVIVNFQNAQPDTAEIARLLYDVKLTDNPVYFQTTQPVTMLFNATTNNTGYLVKGGVAHDPIAYWMRTGSDLARAMEPIISFCKTNEASEFRPFMVESHIYHNNGADPVQELALTLGALVTYMDLLTEAGVPPIKAFSSIFCSISVGTHYLSEIAKLRALRHLLWKVAAAYDLPVEKTKPFIHAKTSSFYHSATASYTNIIRASSEAMSAVTGGCDALTVEGFESHLTKETELSSRIARNTSSVLSYESGLNAVADPAGGSYAIEQMSITLSNAAWALFIEIEDKGGLIKCFEEGYVQDL
ncbi:methylmalonyl-CoA mutase family protein, partial [Dyadobacter sp.]|uniref:methylmalonyl-CoA mutase family protein n=1 Tax=Dyadobacter sp. TaxID=1914288 RepID=UPI003F729679